MYDPSKHKDAPQNVLIDALEAEFGVNIQPSPRGDDVHFDCIDRGSIEFGWDLNAAWVSGMAIYGLCQKLKIDVNAVYLAIRRRAPGVFAGKN